jgi:hypothetical protein
MHKVFIPPAYLTQAGATYTGAPKTERHISTAASPANTRGRFRIEASPTEDSLRTLKQQIITSPSGIKNLNDSRVSYLVQAKTQRDQRRSEIFKPEKSAIQGISSPQAASGTQNLFKAVSIAKKEDQPVRTAQTAEQMSTYNRRQAIARALNLTSRSAPRHNNCFDY